MIKKLLLSLLFCGSCFGQFSTPAGRAILNIPTWGTSNQVLISQGTNIAFIWGAASGTSSTNGVKSIDGLSNNIVLFGATNLAGNGNLILTTNGQTLTFTLNINTNLVTSSITNGVALVADLVLTNAAIQATIVTASNTLATSDVSVSNAVMATLVTTSNTLRTMTVNASNALQSAVISTNGVLVTLISTTSNALLAATQGTNTTLAATIVSTNAALLGAIQGTNSALTATLVATNTAIVFTILNQGTNINVAIVATNTAILSAVSANLILTNTAIIAAIGATNYSNSVALVATNLALTNAIIQTNAALLAAIQGTNTALKAALVASNVAILATAANAANLTSGQISTSITFAEPSSTNNAVTLFYLTNNFGSSSSNGLVAAIQGTNTDLAAAIVATNAALQTQLIATNAALTTKINLTNTALAAAIVATNLALTNAIIGTNAALVSTITNAVIGTNTVLVLAIQGTNTTLAAALISTNNALTNAITQTNATLAAAIVATNTAIQAQIAASVGGILKSNGFGTNAAFYASTLTNSAVTINDNGSGTLASAPVLQLKTGGANPVGTILLQGGSVAHKNNFSFDDKGNGIMAQLTVSGANATATSNQVHFVDANGIDNDAYLAWDGLNDMFRFYVPNFGPVPIQADVSALTGKFTTNATFSDALKTNNAVTLKQMTNYVAAFVSTNSLPTNEAFYNAVITNNIRVLNTNFSLFNWVDSELFIGHGDETFTNKSWTIAADNTGGLDFISTNFQTISFNTSSDGSLFQADVIQSTLATFNGNVSVNNGDINANQNINLTYSSAPNIFGLMAGGGAGGPWIVIDAYDGSFYSFNNGKIIDGAGGSITSPFVTAGQFIGSGSGITNLTASNCFNIASGPIPTGLLTAGYTNANALTGHLLVIGVSGGQTNRYNTYNGGALTNLQGTNIIGSIPLADFDFYRAGSVAVNFTVSGSTNITFSTPFAGNISSNNIQIFISSRASISSALVAYPTLILTNGFTINETGTLNDTLSWQAILTK